MARMPEIEELKRATELRSTLRAVSKPGAGGAFGAELGGSGSARLPQSPDLNTPLSSAFLPYSWPRSSPDFPTI